jgi:dihydroxyacetone kinase-like predicted kinase
VALDANRPAGENAAAMHEVIETIRTGAVTEAARDDGAARFRAGEAIGFVDEQLIAWGEPADTLKKVLGDLASDGAELLTLIAGDGAPLGSEQIAELVPDGIEFELSEGGQPAYWWLLSAE